jgi:hypothetical protein
LVHRERESWSLCVGGGERSERGKGREQVEVCSYVSAERVSSLVTPKGGSTPRFVDCVGSMTLALLGKLIEKWRRTGSAQSSVKEPGRARSSGPAPAATTTPPPLLCSAPSASLTRSKHKSSIALSISSRTRDKRRHTHIRAPARSPTEAAVPASAHKGASHNLSLLVGARAGSRATMSRKESALDLAKFIDKGVRVKLAGGREGQLTFAMVRPVLSPAQALTPPLQPPSTTLTNKHNKHSGGRAQGLRSAAQPGAGRGARVLARCGPSQAPPPPASLRGSHARPCSPPNPHPPRLPKHTPHHNNKQTRRIPRASPTARAASAWSSAAGRPSWSCRRRRAQRR